MNWAQTFLQARSSLTQEQAAAALCGCPVATIRDWEQGRREPPEWVQYLIVAHLLRQKLRPPRRKSTAKAPV